MVNKDFYNEYMKLFLEENSKVNLISKNDENLLWEKHVFDSLAISKFFELFGIPQTLLDIGTGGGFPAIPIAMTYPNIKVYALDSIGKKIRAVKTLAEKLNLKNLIPVCSRAENLDGEFDVVTARAVSSLKNICEYALPKVKKNGYFVSYKSRKVNDEIEEAKPVLTKFNAEIVQIIEYEIPIEQKVTRNLVIIKT